jgi:hypothetical protein
MVRIATNRAMSRQRKANWLETRNGIRDRLRPLAYEILSHGRRKVQPGWKVILHNRKNDLVKQLRTGRGATIKLELWKGEIHF